MRCEKNGGGMCLDCAWRGSKEACVWIALLRGSEEVDQDDAAGHLRPRHGLQLPLGEAEFVGGEVPDVCGGSQVEEQVRQVVQPVGGKDEQVDAAEDVPEGQALVPGLQIDGNLQPTERCRDAVCGKCQVIRPNGSNLKS